MPIARLQPGSRIGLALAGVGLMAACQAPLPPAASGDLRLTGVLAWHHRGEVLEATAEARAAHLEPEGRQARLFDVRLHLPREEATVAAPTMDLDLATRLATGEDGAVITGPTWRLAGPRFALRLGEQRLELSGPVHGRGEVAR